MQAPLRTARSRSLAFFSLRSLLPASWCQEAEHTEPSRPSTRQEKGPSTRGRESTRQRGGQAQEQACETQAKAPSCIQAEQRRDLTGILCAVYFAVCAQLRALPPKIVLKLSICSCVRAGSQRGELHWEREPAPAHGTAVAGHVFTSRLVHNAALAQAS